MNICIQKNNSHSQNNNSLQTQKTNLPSFKKLPTAETIKRDKQIKRNNAISMICGTGLGITIGCLKFASKFKAGLIGGSIGLIDGRIAGALINPREYKD